MRSFIVGVLLIALSAQAEQGMTGKKVEIGQLLPRVDLVGRAGELRLQEGEVHYRAWSSSSLTGRVHLLYIVAARMGIDKINEPLLDALRDAGGVDAFPEEAMKVVSLINIDDVFPMGGSFARQAFEAARREPENAHALFVLDDASKVQKAWGLKRKGAAVIVLDAEGRVVRFKDGKLTANEIRDYIAVLEQLRDKGAVQ